MQKANNMERRPIDIDNLDQLLDKFFAGETTRGQEKALEEYFSSGAPVPDEYECYRKMFAWYAAGMDENELPRDCPVKIEPTSGWNQRKRNWWSSAAASVAIVMAAWLGFNIVTQQSSPTDYAECFVTCDGRVITGEDEIRGDIEAAIIASRTLEQEIDMSMAQIYNMTIN